MKKNLITYSASLLLALFSITVKGQTTKLVVKRVIASAAGTADSLKVKGPVYVEANLDKKAEFPGGQKELNKYFRRKFEPAVRNREVPGKIIANFIVEKDGSLADVIIVNQVPSAVREEAVRVLSTMPSWNAAMQGNEKVRVRKTVAINI